MEASLPIWLQALGYIITMILSVGSAAILYRKDKSSIKNTDAITVEVGAESDRQDSKLSLDWAMEFKKEMETVRQENKELRKELTQTQKQMTDLIILSTNQNARIVKLEGEVNELTIENRQLKVRIKELEDENKKLRGDIKC